MRSTDHAVGEECIYITYDHDVDTDDDVRSRTRGGGASSPPSQTALLARRAARYVWWMPLKDALRYPDRIIAQVMNIGDYEDVQALIEAFGEETLRKIVRHAEVGQFNARSWAYWHYRLGLIPLDASSAVPPLPARRLP